MISILKIIKLFEKSITRKLKIKDNKIVKFYII